MIKYGLSNSVIEETFYLLETSPKPVYCLSLCRKRMMMMMMMILENTAFVTCQCIRGFCNLLYESTIDMYLFSYLFIYLLTYLLINLLIYLFIYHRNRTQGTRRSIRAQPLQQIRHMMN